MSHWGRAPGAGLRSVLLATLLVAATPLAPGLAASPEPHGGPRPLPMVSCGGEPFPASLLAGPRGAEDGEDAPARRLAAAIDAAVPTPDAPPRSDWIRVVDRSDLVVFVAWMTVRGNDGAPLYALTVAPGEAEGPAVDGWDVWVAGPCWPRAELPPGLGHAGWVPAGPVAAADQVFVALVTELACSSGQPATGRVAPPVIVPAPDRVSVSFGVWPQPGDQECPSNPATPVIVTLPEPLRRRALVDGGVVPGRVVQAPPLAAWPDPAPDGSPAGVVVTASLTGTTLAVTEAVTDSIESGVRMVRVRIVDALRLELTLAVDAETILASVPRFCLVGPHAAPDDAGLADRCWGEPDLSALVAAQLPLDAHGRPILAADHPITMVLTVARGDLRCDHPVGAWRLETVVRPVVADGTSPPQRLPDLPLDVPWATDAPITELSRWQSRYCGLATADAEDRPTASPR